MIEMLWMTLLVVAFLSWVAAAAAYAVLAPFAESPTGRQLMFTLTAVSVSLGLIVVNVFWRPYFDPNPMVMRVTIYGLFMLSGLGLFVNILKKQLENRRSQKRVAAKEKEKDNDYS
jgi:hypothetical protein